MSQTGLQWILYRNSGTHASPVLVEMKRVRNVNVPLGKGMADVSRRESQWKRSIGALKESGIEGEYVYKRGTDSNFAALVDSYANNTPIELVALDGPATDPDSWGFKGYFEISELPLDQPLTDGVVIKFKAELADYEENAVLIEPEFVSGGGSSSESGT